MIKYYFLLLLATCQLLIAQNIDICGTDYVMEQFYKENPSLKQEADAYNARLSIMAKNNQLKSYAPNKNGTIYEIPIVVHVVSDGSNEGSTNNKSDQQIRDWIDYTNNVFAATAKDMLGEGKGGAVIPIKFVLAKVTPAGKMSNGINRVNLSKNTVYVNNGVDTGDSPVGISEAELLSNVPQWNPLKYYNIYVVKNLKKGSQGLNGYAYYPTYSSSSKYFSVMNSTASAVDIQTLAHEFGHGMFLHHTHGQGDGSTCNDSDFVNDTEPMKSLYDSSIPRSCQTGKINPCTGVAYVGGEQNIMSYTFCFRNRFTPGQRDRAMQSFLDRKEYLTTSDAKYPPRLYSTVNGTGDGYAWASANNLSATMKLLHDLKDKGYWDSTYPLNVWVAKGYHIPKNQYGGGADRDRTFLLVKNVQLFGGFNGNETSLEYRKPGINETVLNGEKKVAHVLISAGNVGNALLDGFTVWQGLANFDNSMTLNGEGINHSYGGGLYIDNSSPVIRNTLFKDNYSKERGAGVYIENKGQPVFQNVVFMQNAADQGNGDGGAIFVNDSNTKISLLNCTITNNSANDGGAIRFDDDALAVIYNTIIYNNTSKNGAGTVNAEFSFNGSKTSLNAFINKNANNIKNNIFQYFNKGVNNVTTDPKFVSNNYTLQNNSDAINKGNNDLYINPSAAIEKLNIDISSQNRFINSKIDIGAWEKQCTVTAPITDGTNYTFCAATKISGLISKINTTLLTEVYKNASDYTPLWTTDNLTNNTTYFLKFKDTTTGCESGMLKVVVMIENLAKPIFNNVATTCEGTLTLANITANNATNLVWYNKLADGDVLPASTIIKSGVTYYATQKTESCESARSTFVKTLYLVPAAPTANAEQTLALNSTISNIVVSSNNSVQWFSTNEDAIANTNRLSSSTVLQTQNYYAVAQSIEGCRSVPTKVAVIIDATLGIASTLDVAMEIYPNPFKENITLKSPSIITKVSIVDAAGRVVIDSNFNNKEVLINTQKLSAGVYMITVTSEGKNLVKKLIKH